MHSSTQYPEFFERNKIILKKPELATLISRTVNDNLDISLINSLQELGLTSDDAFFFLDILVRPKFKIFKASSSYALLKLYLNQAINSGFGFTEKLNNELNKFQKSINELKEEEVEFLLKSACLIPDDQSDYCFYYFLQNTQFPKLFTNIESCSFDQGGVVVMQLFGNQIYELYTSSGVIIDGPCHDIDLLVDGKYIERGSGNKSGFLLKKMSFSSVSLNGLNGEFNEMKLDVLKVLGDLNTDDLNIVKIRNRDRLEIELGTCINQRIENFKRPYCVDEAVTILLDDNSNYITSPELSIFYRNNKELARLAIRRDPLSYTLLCDSLKSDGEILHCLFMESRAYLDSYLGDISINLNSILTEDDVLQLVYSNRLSLQFLSKEYKNNRRILLAAATVQYNLDFEKIIGDLEEIHLTDSVIMLAVVKNRPSNFKFASEQLKSDSEFVTKCVLSAFDVLEFVSNRFKNDITIVNAALRSVTFGENLNQFSAAEIAQKYSPFFLEQDLYNKLMNLHNANLPF